MTKSGQGRPTVVVVGRYNAGLTIRTPRLPVLDESVLGDAFNMGPGGKGSNQAIAAARLGACSYLLACIGDDLFGQMALELYASEGVDATYVRKTSDGYTGAAIIIIDHAGKNRAIVDVGAGKLLSVADVQRAEPAIRGSQVVLGVLGLPMPTVAYGLKLGREYGAVTILNPAPAQRLEAEFVRQADILTPNETEVRVAVGLAPDSDVPVKDAARQLLKMGAETVIVTLGEQGALVLNRDGSAQVPCPSVHSVDPTGAGDAFNAGLAVALAEGQELLRAVQFANVVGALTTTKIGVIPALPLRHQVEEFASTQA